MMRHPCQLCKRRPALYRPPQRAFKHPLVRRPDHDICQACERRRRQAADAARLEPANA
jgi:hypothetical protein